MSGVVERIKNEPVLVRSLVTLVVAAAAVFGFEVDADQLFAILVVLGLVTVPLTRRAVTPVRKTPGA